MNNFLRLLAAVLLVSALGSAGCVRAPSRQPELVVQAEQYQRRGVKAFQRADYVTAGSMFENALRIYESLDDSRGSLSTRISLVETALRTHDYPAAGRHLEQAKVLAGRKGLEHYRSRIALLESTLALLRGNISEARELVEPLLPAFDGESVTGLLDPVHLAAIANRTRIAFLEEDVRASLWVRRFADGLRRYGREQPVLEARLLRFEARVAEDNGDYDQAERLLDEALSRYKLALSQPGIAATLLQSGKLSVRTEQWDEARRRLRRSASVYTRMLDAEGTAEALTELARLEREQGNRRRASELKRLADDIDRGDPVNWAVIRKAVQGQ